MSIEKYDPLVIDYIKSVQRPLLVRDYSIDFEKDLGNIFPPETFLSDYIESDLEREFGDDYDQRFELEAQLRNEAEKEIINLTNYESPQHKALLNIIELTYRSFATGDLIEKIAYNATLNSNLVNAEIKDFTAIDKPIIFFHSGIFTASYLFCQLYVQLIKSTETSNSMIPFELKDDDETIKTVTFCSTYFYNYYYSDTSKSIPKYTLNTNFEKNLLAVLLSSISLFIYSHESGHAYFKHYQDDDTKSKEDRWKDEFIADRFAMNRILEYYSNNEEARVFTLIAPIIFFKYLFLLEKYKPEINVIDTHPPTYYRLEKYYACLEEVVRPEDKAIFLQFLELEQNISFRLVSIFDKIDVINKKI